MDSQTAPKPTPTGSGGSARSGGQQMGPAITCEFSRCRRYRYVWELTWNPARRSCAFIGLNCSTADETGPDPTVRRCVNFAKNWGYGSLTMLNLFAFRATDPRNMKAASDPIGPDNDGWLRRRTRLVVDAGGIIVAAWGTHGTFMGRAGEVVTMLRHREGIPLYCLSKTKTGEPAHPLYLKGDLKPQRWDS